MSRSQGRIDVHHHVIPPAFTATMSRRGLSKVAGAPLPNWTPKQSIEIMDINGIETALTSLSAPGVYFGDRKEAIALARDCNEFSASMREQHPGRFGMFAVLPMPLTEEACAEAEYALDTLNADGIVLLASTEGHFLGDPRFEELMAELDRRKATVFVHPNMHKTSDEIGLNLPGFLIEFLCDTTRGALNLIASGTMERYPNIRWILSHSGGFLPYVAWRVSLSNMMPDVAEKTPRGVMTYIKNFYYDTALSPSVYSLGALKELVDPSHILFGSDFPFAPAPITALQTKTLSASEIFNAQQKSAIGRDNALALFPHYKQDGEVPGMVREFSPMNSKAKFKAKAIKPLVHLVDRLRNR
ncbi:Uncharacterised protein [Zhongshania aliphaticivorans]|uniref:Amidohydrolase-related domain-containing protein n=1 Tax=Zhongshania aliphaticivorans TaxID=1470434 RepID=A0A5S9PWA2_9GAMM|nr:amidohydrolase family protein [Zhongshania aliphaticivorans]CAA0092200.1 Uncharacterised protein [Zhongshania aliphaticivorans]CAA0109345.1 Uncharacterised protein [Zhongshania aliphaticivorans]